MALPNHDMTAPFLAETDDEVEETQEAQQVGLTADQLQDILENQSRLNAENLQRVLQGPPRGQPLQEEIRAPGLSLEGLPHPSVDLDGFNRGLAERLAQRDQGLIEQVTQRSVQAAQTVSGNQALFARAEALIKEVAPEIPDDVIEFAASKIAQGYSARGINPLDALRSNLEGVAQEVLDYADERFSPPEARSLARKNTGGGRTAVPGSSGARVSRPAPKQDDGEGDTLVSELRKLQTNLRLY